MLLLVSCGGNLESRLISSRRRLNDEGVKSGRAKKDVRIELHGDNREEMSHNLLQSSRKSTSLDVLKPERISVELLLVLLLVRPVKTPENIGFIGEAEDGGRCRFRTCDPYRVKVMLYH